MEDDYNDGLTDVFSGGVIVAVGFVSEYMLAFLFKIIAARYLGTNGLGEFALGAAITSVAPVALLGLDRGIARYIPRDDEESHHRGVLQTGAIFTIPSGIIAGVGVYLTADLLTLGVFGGAVSADTVRVFAVSIPFWVLTRFAVGGLRGGKSSLLKVYVQNLSLPLSRFAIAISAVLLGFGVMGFAWAFTLSYVVSGTLGAYLLVRRTPILDKLSDDLMPRELLRFSLPLMLITAANIVMTQIDTLMLGVITGSSEVGIYNAAYSLGRLCFLGLFSFNFIAMPVLSEFHSDGKFEDMRSLYQTVTKWIFIVTFPIVLLFVGFPDLVLTTIYGESYAVGATAFVVLTVGILSNSIGGPNEETLVAMGNTRTMMLVSSLVVVLNGALNVLLIPRYSYVGAAVATATAYVCLNAMFGIELYRTRGIHPLSGSLTRLLVLGALIVTGTHLLADTLDVSLPFGVAIFVFAMAVFLLGLAAFGGLGEAEKQIVNILEHRIGADLGQIKRIIDYV